MRGYPTSGYNSDMTTPTHGRNQDAYFAISQHIYKKTALAIKQAN